MQAKWDLEYSVQEIEMQLSGYKFTEKVKSILQPTDEMLLLQRRLIKTILPSQRRLSKK